MSVHRPTLVFHFTAGRYHATPWYSHVNEGAIEWPPCPWRLLRSLIAVGCAKADWLDERGLIRAEVKPLLIALAGVLPVYALPQGRVAHTRHYMPTDGETTKVLDAFVRFESDQPLRVHYPVDLGPSEFGLLATAARRMTYLGRAESWVDVEVQDDVEPDTSWTEPADLAGGLPPDREHVSLLSAQSAEAYAAWASSMSGGKDASKGKRARGLEPPADLVECLGLSTDAIQKAGWAQPPGTRRALYCRPRGALEPSVLPPRSAPPRPFTTPMVVLALSADTASGTMRPSYDRALPHMETLHDAAVHKLAADARLYPALTGRELDGTPLTGHGHAHWIPLDLDGDGRIDHVVVHAPRGLGTNERRALREIPRTWGKGLPSIIVSYVGHGDRVLLASALRNRRNEPPPELGHGTVWESVTPFLAPRFLKPRGNNAFDAQVRAECASRGLPVPVVEVLPRAALVDRGFLRFVRSRRPGHPQPPSTTPYALRLTFPEPVAGPLTLGYGAHFGLGVFAVTGGSDATSAVGMP